MRARSLVVAAGIVAALVLPSIVRAADEDGYRHGHVRFVESGVTLHRATEVSAEEALANVPFLPGDRVWSDASGRVEFQFPDATLVRLDRRSKLDYSGHEEGDSERIVLRLWSGSLIARVRAPQAARFEIETPAGSVELRDQAMVRVDVDSGETRVSAFRGEAVLDDGRERVRLSAGERTLARWGGAAAAPEAFDISPEDDFGRWDEGREAEERWASRSSEYLPAELDPYAGELERNGSWRFEGSAGYVWTPRVAWGWSPYTNGHWSWTPYGWTWVPYETWGWAPSHYGRWGFSASFGWYWAPGRTWGPGWVSWGVGSGYVGWCPLGYRDRPVYAWGGQGRGYAVPRGGGHGGWNVVREGDFGHRDVARRRVPLAGIDPRSLQVAESARSRLTRDGRSLVETNPTPRAISRRPTPGDFVRELAVDNKTTIPSPWLRRGRARAVEGAAGDARDQATAARQRRGAVEAGAPARSGAEAGSAGASPERSAARPRASRSLPWFAPRGEEATAGRDRPAAPQAREWRRDVQSLFRDPQAYRRGGEDPPEAQRIPSRTQTRQETPTSRPRPEATQTQPREGYQPRAERTERPAREYSRPESSRPPQEYSRPEAPRAPRIESGSRPSRGDSGARSEERQRSGGEQHSRREQRSGDGQHSAPRPSHNRR